MLTIGVTIAILYYEYCLTFYAEVNRFWGSGISWSSTIFFTNRYLALLMTIPTMLEFFGNLSDTWSIAGSGTSHYTPQSFPWPGCDIPVSKEQVIDIPDLALAYGSMLVIDTLVFVLTVSRAMQLSHLWKSSIFRLMLRDGEDYTVDPLLVFTC
ncbi:hypothetical protein OBBRIDRAFT_728323 [Obba rivulosa]|uniref:DUF6533 domain-containing protein n=1 Tax=Obba rivulosa TaxID=1052685 RepID=A0A8E2B3M2_9APHY|nr:hypothetical protein OBBRIDRAFT_728323 [Obba rivulosa]